MKIAMVSEHASPLAVLGGVDAGGQNVHVAELARGLAALGDDVVVHTRRDDPTLPCRVPFGPRVTIDHVDAGPAAPIPKDELLPHMRRFAADLADVWRDDRPDAVLSHFWMSGVATLQAARPLGIPVAHTFHALGVVKRRHQGAADTSPRERLPLEATVARNVDLVIATSFEERCELIAMGAEPRRVCVVPCGVDLDRFAPRPARVERDRARHRVVVVSRLVERKGIGNVIEAIADVPHAELLIAGGPPRVLLDEDPESMRFRELAQALGVGDRVRLLGGIAREDVPALIQSADVVACCPWYEPFGIVAVEAMACGVPVVASAVGGLAETVVDGVTGRHVPPRRPDRIAAALRDLLANDDERRRMGAAAARRARRYGWSSICAETRTHLTQMWAASPRTPTLMELRPA